MFCIYKIIFVLHVFYNVFKNDEISALLNFRLARRHTRFSAAKNAIALRKHASRNRKRISAARRNAVRPTAGPDFCCKEPIVAACCARMGRNLPPLSVAASWATVNRRDVTLRKLFSVDGEVGRSFFLVAARLFALSGA